MLKIYQKSLIACIVIMNAFFFHLEAIQIKTEFYLAENLPDEYKKMSDGGNCTIITLQGYPLKSIISVDEMRLIPKGVITNKGSKNMPDGGTIVWVVSSNGYIPGLPVTFLFKDTKRKLTEKVTVIPNRLYVKSSVDNAEIEAKIIQANPACYQIKLKGFAATEELEFQSTSYDEVIEYKVPCDKDVFLTTMPGVINKPGGVASLRITRPSGEILKLELPWGLEWMRYSLFYDTDGTVKSVIETKDFRKKNPGPAKYFFPGK